jgi:hypothetical protein
MARSHTVRLIVSIFFLSCLASSKASAAEIDPATEYLIFSTSTRDKALGEKRFTSRLKIIYGNPESLKNVFGERGPSTSQTLSLSQGGSSVKFASKDRTEISNLRFNSRASGRYPILSFKVLSAICRIKEMASYRCNGTVRVFKNRNNSIRGRLEFISDDGLRITNGKADVSSLFLYAPDISQ